MGNLFDFIRIKNTALYYIISSGPGKSCRKRIFMDIFGIDQRSNRFFVYIGFDLINHRLNNEDFASCN